MKESRPAYRCADLLRWPAGGDQVLVSTRENARACLLPSLEVQLLIRCRTFRPLNAHAEALCAEFGLAASRQPLIRGILARAARRGLMSSAREIRRRAAAVAGAPRPQEKITAVGIITHDRLASLRRGLHSYMENARAFGRRAEFVVANDCPDPGVRNNSKEALRELRKAYNMPVLFAGIPEKETYSRFLIERGLPKDIVRFALFGSRLGGPTYGANRNSLLLHAVGETIFCPEDDTFCRIAAAPGLSRGLRLSSTSDPTEFWFHDSLKSALDEARFFDKDILALHEQLLGKTVGTCLRELLGKAPVDLDFASPGFLRSIQSRSNRIALTMMGLIGDCALGSPYGYLALTGESRRRLLLGRAHYRKALSRSVLRVAPCHTVSDGPFFMTYGTGFDNRRLLPPFIPVFRNDDGLFMATMRKCWRTSSVGHIPWALLHSPPERRAFSYGDFSDVSAYSRACDFLLQWINSIPAREEGQESQALMSLGRRLQELGRLPLPEFQEEIRMRRWQHAAAVAAELEGLLDFYKGAPDFWTSHVRGHLGALRAAVEDRTFAVPCDLRDGRDPGEAMSLLRRLAHQFGLLLEWWPAFWAAAEALRHEGRRLARPV